MWRRLDWAFVIRTLAILGTVVIGILITILANALPVYQILRDPNSWIALFVVILLITIMTSILNNLDGRTRRGPPDIGRRIYEASEAMENVAALVDELQAEMGVRVAALKRIQEDSDEFEHLASLHRQEAEAVTKLVESVIASTHAKLDRKNSRSQLLYFFGGLACSIPAGVLVNLWTR